MSYNNEKLKQTHQVRVRFNDYVYAEIVSHAEASEEQLAVFLRNIVIKTLNDPEALKALIKNHRGM
jgi:hypothetical protein